MARSTAALLALSALTATAPALAVSPKPVPVVKAPVPVVETAPAQAADVAPPVVAPPVVAPPVSAPAAAVMEDADKAAKRTLRLAVYEFEATDVDKRLARVVTDSIVAELRKLQRVSVVSMDEVKAMLDMEAQKQLTGCGDDSCLAEIAEALGVDGIVIGQLAHVGDEIVFGMKRLDQRSAKATGQVNQRLKADDGVGESALAMVGPAVAQLFPEYPLRPGATRGVSPEMALRVNPPPLDTWVFWTGAGVTTVAVATGVVATVFNLGSFVSTDNFVTSHVKSSTIIQGSELTSQTNFLKASFVTLAASYGVALIAGSATGVTALFTDWNGYRAAAVE